MVRTLSFATALLLLWVLLTGGETTSWIIGAPTVAAALWAAWHLRPESSLAVRPAALLAFLPFFLWHSLRGGWDVAQRAFRPTLPLAPGRIQFSCHLPAGPPRLLFGNVINLLPGTLLLTDREGILEIHVLDRTAPLQEELTALEERIGRLFGWTAEGRP